MLEVEDGQPGAEAMFADAARVLLAAGESWGRLTVGGELLVPRIRRPSAAEKDSAPTRFTTDGTILITGATGTLGTLVAEHLVRAHSVRSLALVSRRGRTDASDAVDAALTAAGVRVRRYACDVGDRTGLARVLADIDDLTGVVHAAGVTGDGVITALDPNALDAVLDPKLVAAQHLDDLTRDHALTAFVVFSSLAGIVGAPGQGNYAAANAGLDAIVAARRRLGLPGVSVAWGVWARDSGLTGDLTNADRNRMRRSGMVPLSTPAGLALFDAALSDSAEIGATSDGVLVAAAFDRTHIVGQVPPVLSSVLRAAPVARDAAVPATAAASWSPSALRDLVVKSSARALGTSVTEIEATPGAVFRDLGFDSLLSVELRNALALATGLVLPASVVFDHPTVAALADHLADLLGPPTPAPAPAPTPKAAPADGTTDPVVIVGMSCRFPGGVRTPDDLWALVATGTDAVGGFPENRGWDRSTLVDPDPDAVGHTYTDQGGFLHDADEFDAAFFGITPREAVTLDPQQRLLLEASWQALENGGLDPAALRGSDTGVFVGMMYHDYGSSVTRPPAELEGYLANGSAGSVASGRIAYTFGFEGPTLTVDTACSSSLVTTHLAAAAILAGECEVALAGGVTVMATPQTFIEFSRQRGLAPDGRCKSFSATADGTGWSEGVGMLVLMRRSVAVARGHRELAVLRGSAVNSDGASNGLTAPHGPSQRRVIARALAVAGLTGADVDMVEAHGTGTRLGDPIEAGALLATYGQGRPVDDPVRIGSLKSNIGHAQAAAGVGGIIKCVLAMRHGVMPQTLHVDAPTPGVDWSSGAVSVLTEAHPWPDRGRPRRAAVSAFGISGTNAHVILEAAEAPEVTYGPVRADADPEVVVISARDAESVAVAARALAEHVRTTQPAVADVAHTLRARGLHRYRAAVLASSAGDLGDGLTRLADGIPGDGTFTGAVGDLGSTGALFSGQGAQRPGMAAELAAASPAFAAELDDVVDALDAHLSRPLRPLLWPDAAEGPAAAAWLACTEFAQPALFAVSMALYRFLVARGWHTDAVVGHSVGEYAAAVAAGVLDLPDAARLVCARGAAMQACPAGGMASVGAPHDRVRALLSPDVDVAAINGPAATVISGSVAAIESASATLAAAGLRVRRLVVSHAFHSAAMVAAADAFAPVAAAVRYREPQLPFFSTSTGAQESTLIAGPDYWVEQIRRPVLFDAATRAMLAHGVHTTVEFGPGAVLAALGADVAEDDRVPASWVPLLRTGRPEVESVAAAAAALVVRGASARLLGAVGTRGPARLIDLPGHPLRRDRYWLHEQPGSTGVAPAAGGQDAVDHTLLTASMTVAGQAATVYTARLSTVAQPWLAEHVVAGVAVLPATVLLELVRAVGAAVGADVVMELTVDVALELADDAGRDVQVVRADTGPQLAAGQHAVQVFSRPVDGGEWTEHASAVVGRPGAPLAPSEDPVEGGAELRVDYDVLADRGLAYGPSFRGASVVLRTGASLRARVQLPPAGDGHGDYEIHPALVDACLHPLSLTDDGGQARVPFAWYGVRYIGRGDRGTVTLCDLSGEGNFSAVSVRLTDDDGHDLLTVDRLVTRRLVAPRPDARSVRPRLRVLGRSPVTLPPVGDFAANVASLADPFTDGDPAAAPVTMVDARDLAGHSLRTALESVIGAAQRWLADPDSADTLVVLVHRALAGGSEPPDPRAAAVAAALSAAQAEHPGRLVVIDVADPLRPANDLSFLAAAAVASGAPRLALGPDGWSTPILLPPNASDIGDAGRDALAPFDPTGTVLVTGGTGALGVSVARHLVQEHGVRRLLLVSRRGRDAPGASDVAADLVALGATVDLAACDVADRAAMRRLLAAVPEDHPVAAVVHTAGVLDDALIADQTPARLDAALRPKADAVEVLDELLGPDVRAFVLFSSLAGVLGAPGQANYAAANAYLDAVAARRRAAGLPAVSIAWGAWADGMAGELGQADLARLAAAGMRPLASTTALAMFDAAVGAELSRDGLVVAAEWSAPAAAVRDTSQPLAEILAAADPAKRLQLVLDVVRAEVAAVAALPHARSVPLDRAFGEVGFDSLMSVDLRNRLSSAAGLRIPATAVFDHPTPRALAGFVLGLLAPPADSPSADALDALDADALIALALRGDLAAPGSVGKPQDRTEDSAR